VSKGNPLLDGLILCGLYTICLETNVFCLLTIFSVVGNKIILDGEQIRICNRCIFHLRAQLIAKTAQRCVERNCSSVIGLETAILIKITVVFPWYGKLLWQATKSPRPMYPKVSATIAI
jgi:hypothetical protein